MNKIKRIYINLSILLCLLCINSNAQDTCSRIAMINFQEVLVDTSSSNKGEGLRFYIEKDPIAKKYLESYQEKNKPKWYSTLVGSAGTFMVLYGTFQSSTSTFNKSTFLYSGVSLLILNYLMAKTNDHNNEYFLNKSINEYNKRNLPRIYFNPIVNNKKFGVRGGILKEF
jgi:hypothetical protein